MRISNLSNKSGNPSASDYLVLDDGTTVTKIDYNKLAKAIIENYAGSNIAGSTQTLKAALDSLNSKTSDSGWIELTTNVKYRKVGKICYVNIDGYTATQTSGAETIGTLPEGYRPTITAQWCGRKGASTLLGGWVTSAGLIRYTAVSASGTIAALITFPVG